MQENKTDQELRKNYHKIAAYQLVESTHERVYALKKAYQRRNILFRIRQRFSASDTLDVLEFGAGMGCLVDLMKEAFSCVQYTVIDNNEGTLVEISDRFPEVVSHLVCEYEQLVQIDQKFDVIVAVDVWEHLPPDMLTLYTRWCYDTLKPGGMMILQFPNWGCPLTASTFYNDLTHVNRLNEKSIQQLFELVGIPAVNYRLYNRKTPGFLGVVRDACMGIYCIYVRLLHILFGTVRLRFFAADLIVTVEKTANS